MISSTISPTLSSTESSDSQAQRRLRSVSLIWPGVSAPSSEIGLGFSETSASLNDVGRAPFFFCFRVPRSRGAGTAPRLHERPGAPPPPPCGAAYPSVRKNGCDAFELRRMKRFALVVKTSVL